MPLINCTECGKQVSTEAKACPNCGHPVAEMHANLPVGYIKCPYCHKEAANNLDACPHCHMPIAQSIDTSAISWLLIICGIITLVYFWSYKTSVSTGFFSDPILANLIGYFFAVVFAQFLIAPIQNRLWRDLISKSGMPAQKVRPRAWHATVVGFVERTLYVAVLQASAAYLI